MPSFMDMLLLFAGIAFLLWILASLGSLLSRKPEQSQSKFPYEKIDHLFTPTERRFHRVLEEALQDSFRIYGQVRLADLIKVKKELPGSDYRIAFRRISSKHIDFVLCDPVDHSTLFAIELDDASHSRKDRQERDAFVDSAMAAAGLPLIRFPVKDHYAPEEILERIFPNGSRGAPSSSPMRSAPNPA